MMKFTEFPCDLCGEKNGFEVPHSRLYTNNQPIHICSTCGFVYVRRRRSAEEIAADWSTMLFGEHYTAHLPAIKARLRYVAEFIDVHVGLAGKSLVDIGAGEGEFLRMIRNDYSASVFGIEPSRTNCQQQSELGIENFCGTIEDYLRSGSLSSSWCDIITIVWTLENCNDPNKMLQAAYEMLKEGGQIVVATGSRILVPFKKPLHHYLNNTPADTNSFRFSANSLREILHKNGFRTREINRYIDSDPLVVIAEKQLLGSKIETYYDDPLKVYDFFDRWHRESIHYR